MLNFAAELIALRGDEFLQDGHEAELSPAAQAVREKMDSIGRRPGKDGLIDNYGDLRYGAGMYLFPLEWENTLGDGKYFAFAAWHDCMGSIEGHELIVSLVIDCNFYPTGGQDDDEVMETYLIVLSLVGGEWKPYCIDADGRAIVIQHDGSPEGEWLGDAGEIEIGELLRLTVEYSRC
jgi:hypothetical protein